MLTALQSATRQYVRRQLVFFRAEAAYRFVSLLLLAPAPQFPPAPLTVRCGLSVQMKVPTPALPIIPPIPHPQTLQLSRSVLNALTADITGLVQQPAVDFWWEHRDDAMVEEQRTARDESKEAPNAPARRLYHTQLFIYNDQAKVRDALQRIAQLRTEQPQPAGYLAGRNHEVDDGDEEKAQLGKRLRLGGAGEEG